MCSWVALTLRFSRLARSMNLSATFKNAVVSSSPSLRAAQRSLRDLVSFSGSSKTGAPEVLRLRADVTRSGMNLSRLAGAVHC